MWKDKRVSKLQVSGSMPRGKLGDAIETNLRLVIGDAATPVTCHRFGVESGIWSDDLRQTICSVLRRRDRLIAVPSPAERTEILVVGPKGVSCKPVKRDHWHATLHNIEQELRLQFTNEHELNVIADLVQKALVLTFETKGSYWRLGNSARYWHARQPRRVVKGIEVVPRFSFATLPLAGEAVGIAFDSGFLFRSEWSVADFFDSQLDAGERARRQQLFEQFRGTLLYDVGSNEHHVCYFDHFGNGKSLDTTGQVCGYRSLYEYCRVKHKHIEYHPDDPVAYVSFKGLSEVVPVPAKQLKRRVMLQREEMPKELREMTSTAPSARRNTIVNLWDGCNQSVLRPLGLHAETGLWRPVSSDHELLACPELVFGKGRRVTPPAEATIHEYRRYYRQRMAALRDGGVFRFEPCAGRDIHLVTPVTSSRWPDTLHKAFVQDFTESISDFTGQTFSVHEVRADTVERIVERLEGAVADHSGGGSRTAVVVFDDKLGEPAPYCLLSHALDHWRLKRVTRRTVEKKWSSRQDAYGQEAERYAEQRWRSMIELTVLDTLLQMNATPWRLREMRDNYDACLAIDVGEGKRYYAMSLLICRADSMRPSYLRVTRVWPKGDFDREEINRVQLQGKMAWMFEQYHGSSFSPLESLLILRDGRVCGAESHAIDNAVDRLHRMDRLQQSACVDVVDVHKKTVKDLRMWYPVRDFFTNVLEGQAVYLTDKRALVSCTGIATLPPTVTTEPCLLEAHRDADIRRVARGFFSFAQLNYSTPAKAHRCALPINLTDAELRQKMSQDTWGIK